MKQPFARKASAWRFNRGALLYRGLRATQT